MLSTRVELACRRLLRFDQQLRRRAGADGDFSPALAAQHHGIGRRIAALDLDWLPRLEIVALDDIEVLTMNGNPAKAFQLFGLKPA